MGRSNLTDYEDCWKSISDHRITMGSPTIVFSKQCQTRKNKFIQVVTVINKSFNWQETVYKCKQQTYTVSTQGCIVL